MTHIPRPTWAEIDLDALAHNARALRARLSPGAQLMAVVKANAYGHGAAAVARGALGAGATWLAVATLSEALELRADGLAAPVLVLGYTPPAQAAAAAARDVALTVYDPDVADAYAAAGAQAGRALRVHLKIDTGMNRLGVAPEDAAALAARLAAHAGLAYEGVYTHFARADERDQSHTDRQLARFRGALAALEARGLRPALAHAANSAATLLRPDAHFDLVRAGIVLYGLDPSDEVTCPPEFRPVLAFKTTVTQVRRLPPGAEVSYGGEYVTPGEETLATIAVGYADGFRRGPRRWEYALVRGQRAPLVARVCMDQALLNVTRIPGVRLGDEVVLLGRQGGERITAMDVARWLGTNNYDVVCAISARVPRVAG
jgi:alanine racemase